MTQVHFEFGAKTPDGCKAGVRVIASCRRPHHGIVDRCAERLPFSDKLPVHGPLPEGDAVIKLPSEIHYCSSPFFSSGVSVQTSES